MKFILGRSSFTSNSTNKYTSQYARAMIQEYPDLERQAFAKNTKNMKQPLIAPDTVGEQRLDDPKLKNPKKEHE